MDSVGGLGAGDHKLDEYLRHGAAERVAASPPSLSAGGDAAAVTAVDVRVGAWRLVVAPGGGWQLWAADAAAGAPPLAAGQGATCSRSVGFESAQAWLLGLFPLL